MYREVRKCRVCGSENLAEYLDLGMMPLSNNLCDTPEQVADRFPLKVLFCEDCYLSQLSVVINPEILFGHYVYRSSIAQGYVDHCRKMAKDLKERYNLTEDSFHVDIAGNDGTLLGQFREEIGLKVLNIDPAKNLAAISSACGVPALCFFWGEETARRVVNGFGQADLITATNVFAHVDDVEGFLNGVKIALKPTGVLVLEFPYLIDFIEKVEFDTIYFEHLSYFSINPLKVLCDKVGLTLMSVEKQDIHGGTVRVTIGYGQQDSSVLEYCKGEMLYAELWIYNEWALKVRKTIENFRDELNVLKVSGAKIAGFAASAKGNTLLNSAGVTTGTMSYIVDQTPEKIGKYSPGTHIPIVSMMDMQRNPPDYLVILSWNFEQEIKDKCRKAGYKGKFIIPIPEFKISE